MEQPHSHPYRSAGREIAQEYFIAVDFWTRYINITAGPRINHSTRTLPAYDDRLVRDIAIRGKNNTPERGKERQKSIRTMQGVEAGVVAEENSFKAKSSFICRSLNFRVCTIYVNDFLGVTHHFVIIIKLYVTNISDESRRNWLTWRRLKILRTFVNFK